MHWRLLRKLIGPMACACLLSHPVPAAEQPDLEYRVKAAFLFYFANFVEWPGGFLPQSQNPVSICILGADPFGEILDLTISNKAVRSRALVVRRAQQLDALNGCNILFISRSETSRLRRILQGLEGKNVLSVSEAEETIRLGGIVQFVLEERKVRFDINLAAARAAGLKISAKLLHVAREVIR
jgi:hypothetical protein